MTREEAIKIVKESINGTCLHLVDQEALETLIPELKESEDEKTRKELISFLQLPHPQFVGNRKQDKWIAYLEKQKEPDDAWTEEDEAKVKVMCKEGDLKPSEREWLKKLKNRIVKKEQKPTEFDEYKIIKKHITEDSLSSEVNKRLTECEWYVTDEKPAEWSEEDKFKLEDAITGIDVGIGFYETEGKHPNLLKAIIEAKDWLKSLPERFNLQPKNEWTEEDKHRCKDAIYFLETAKKHYADTSEIELTIEWLKSLHPQAKQEQKPEAKLTGWVARDSEHNPYFGLGLTLFNEKPKRSGDCWNGTITSQLPWNLFPDLKWEDEPIEVEVTIRKK